MRVDRVGCRALNHSMNSIKGVGYAIALIAAALIAGCSSPKSEPIYSDVPGASAPSAGGQAAEVAVIPAPQVKEEVAPASAETTADKAGEEKPELIVTPDETLTGSIVSVNDVGRFVVLRFPLGRMPANGSTLFVYRQGMKVAELKVTGPRKDDHTVADVKSGDCRLKDEVRDR